MAPSVVTNPEMGKVVGETTQARMVLCSLKRAAWGQVPARARNLREGTAETDSPPEETGFEPYVPPREIRLNWCRHRCP